MFKKVLAVVLLTAFFTNICALNVLAYPMHSSKQHDPVAELSEVLRLTAQDIHSAGLPAWSPQADFLKNNIAEYQVIVERYLRHMQAQDAFDVAPGCLPLYSLAFLDIFLFTPMLAGYALFALYGTNIQDVECAGVSFLGSLVPFTWGLINWIDYRICAEENTGAADPETINLLQQDRDFLVRLSFACLAVTIVSGSICGWDTVFRGIFQFFRLGR